MYYLESRYYDPELCRFISADALLIASPIGMNLFAYCNNDPVNFVDPHGYACKGAYGNCQFGGCCQEGPDAACNCAALGCPYEWEKEEEEEEYISLENNSLGVSVTGVYPKSVIRIFRAVVNFFTNVPGWKLESKTESSYCFVAGTLVSQEDGNVPIEEIQPGDYVWAWNEQTGEVELKRVVETYINETKELVHVFVNGEEIIATPSHPFYSPVKGWTSAANLRARDVLVLVLVNGEYVVIEKIDHELLESFVEVYNFHVEDVHTYYVGKSNVLVHNKCPQNQSFGYLSNNTDARKAAAQLGYEPTKYIVHGQTVFVNKKASSDLRYITRDVDSHNGGVWKAANSVKALGSSETRSGTYDAQLRYIKK